MSVAAVATRYAKSLIDIAVEQNKLEKIHDDMQGFKSSLASRDLVMMLKSPIINSSKKIDAFNAVFGDKMDETTMSFFNLVMKKGREAALPEIAKSFIEQYRAKKNISSAKVITATKLSQEKLEAIKASLSKSGNTTFEVEDEVDESLIGGFVIEMGDKIYDASVKHKLDKIRKTFS